MVGHDKYVPELTVEHLRELYAEVSCDGASAARDRTLSQIAANIGWGVASGDKWDEAAQVAVRYFGPSMRLEIARVIFDLVRVSYPAHGTWRRFVRVLTRLPKLSTPSLWTPVRRSKKPSMPATMALFRGRKPRGPWVSLANTEVGMAWLLGGRYDLWSAEVGCSHGALYTPSLPLSVLLAFVQDETFDRFQAIVDHQAEWSTARFLDQSLLEGAIEYAQPKCARYVLQSMSDEAGQASLRRASRFTISRATSAQGCNSKRFAARVRILVELCPAMGQEIIDAVARIDARYSTSYVFDVLEIISGTVQL